MRPHEALFYEFYDGDGTLAGNAYAEAVADYDEICKVWKPFVYRVRVRLPDAKMTVEKSGYADTLEEAMSMADVVMRTHGILLVDGGSDHPVMVTRHQGQGASRPS